MIIKCEGKDFMEIYAIINDGAMAYQNVIPEDRWHDPYMTEEELSRQVNEGVAFWAYITEGRMAAAMGIQFKDDVTLIRHAYVRSTYQHKGLGSLLLGHLRSLTNQPILIGTWAAANWAIRFYQKHGFRLLPENEKNALLRKYWNIPERQVQTSVVLASHDWQGLLSR